MFPFATRARASRASRNRVQLIRRRSRRPGSDLRLVSRQFAGQAVNHVQNLQIEVIGETSDTSRGVLFRFGSPHVTLTSLRRDS